VAPAVRRAIWLICFPVAVLDGYDTLLLSFLAPLISKDLHVQPDLLRGVFTATYTGAALGAILLGAAADRFGRKPLLVLSLALTAVFTALTAGSHTLNELMWSRAAAGLGLGGAIPIISALAAHGIPQEHRRAAVTRVFIGYPVGAILGGIVTALITTHVGWRGLMLGTAVLAATLIPLTHWGLDEPPPAVSHNSRALLPQLFADGRATLTTLLCVSVFLILAVSYFLVSWIPTVLTLEGLSPQKAAAIAVLLNVGGLLGAWVLAILGRQAPTRFIGLSLCVGALLIAAFGIALGGSQVTAAATVICIGFLVIGAQINIPALTAWLFPPNLAASAVGLAMACGRLGSIAGPLLGGYLLASHLGWKSLFLIAALPALLAGLALLIPTAPESVDTPHR
jgi:AAHS family 4-hydroxybenzoate transporter-like MFS transporter